MNWSEERYSRRSRLKPPGHNKAFTIVVTPMTARDKPSRPHTVVREARSCSMPCISSGIKRASRHPVDVPILLRGPDRRGKGLFPKVGPTPCQAELIEFQKILQSMLEEIEVYAPEFVPAVRIEIDKMVSEARSALAQRMRRIKNERAGKIHPAPISAQGSNKSN